MHRRTALILLIAVLLASITSAIPVFAQGLDRAALEQMTVEQLKQYAAENQVNLGSATSRDGIIAVILDAQASKEHENLKLPDKVLFQPILPDTSPGTLPGNALTAGRLILGVFALGCLIYAAFRFLVLAMEALSGKKSLAQISLQLLTYGVAVSIILGVFGGAIYQLLAALFEFFRFSLSK